MSGREPRFQFARIRAEGRFCPGVVSVNAFWRRRAVRSVVHSAGSSGNAPIVRLKQTSSRNTLAAGPYGERRTVLKIRTARLIYFSPTRTTKAVLEAIADGIGVDRVRSCDMTYPEADQREFEAMEVDELALIGAPVYAGRLPIAAVRRFRKISSKGNPAVLVVLYGNREIEDALLELTDLAEGAGFLPVAGSAFIGEHSFSSESVPLSEGRPDMRDREFAGEFGVVIGERLRAIRSIDDLGRPKVPGNRPYKERVQLPKASPVADANRCVACGACVPACPTGAIVPGATARVVLESCILCCACIRACPAHARTLNDPSIVAITERLRSLTARRKEPEIFMDAAPSRRERQLQ